MSILRFFDSIFKPRTVLAHCDVPCGIYDVRPAQIAAQTVVRMVELIESIPKGHLTLSGQNSMTRYILTKEEHARKCKKEILILWTDFFKPEHLEKFPNLHDIFWKTAKLCSKNKQEVNMDAARELMVAVDKIAKIFEEAKKAAKK